MTRRLGLYFASVAACALIVAVADDASAFGRRGNGNGSCGSHGGNGSFGSFGGNGSFGGHGSFGGRFGRRGNGSCGSHGGHYNGCSSRRDNGCRQGCDGGCDNGCGSVEDDCSSCGEVHVSGYHEGEVHYGNDTDHPRHDQSNDEVSDRERDADTSGEIREEARSDEQQHEANYRGEQTIDETRSPEANQQRVEQGSTQNETAASASDALQSERSEQPSLPVNE